ncbi:hypothetical protein FPV67DRAFT_1673049 [Lyophyllum atratum]|nr:hypothetical protein FPV67DRAFT_1673042 [Lyophyllum atratum]KAF8062579.1 hypothetical protein FPV67DRAFT_1673049 [Lyophyllum atratum]
MAAHNNSVLYKPPGLNFSSNHPDPASPKFFDRLKSHIIGWGIVCIATTDDGRRTTPLLLNVWNSCDETSFGFERLLMMTNNGTSIDRFNPAHAIVIGSHRDALAQPLSATAAGATQVSWAPTHHENHINSLMIDGRLRQKLIATTMCKEALGDLAAAEKTISTSGMYRSDKAEARKQREEALEYIRREGAWLAVFYDLDTIDHDEEAKAMKTYLTTNQAFFNAKDGTADPLAVFYRELQGHMVADIERYIGRFLNLRINASEQMQLRAVLSDYYWTSAIARLSNWDYFRTSPELQLQQQYKWHVVGSQFAGPFAHMAVHLLDGLCSTSLRSSPYHPKASPQSPFFAGQVQHFHRLVRKHPDHRQVQYHLLDRQFFLILEECYNTHLRRHHKFFGQQKEGASVHISIWNQAFEEYAGDVLAQLETWVCNRKAAYIGDHGSQDLLSEITNKMKWYLLGQVHNTSPSWLPHLDTCVPMIELNFLRAIADEMTELAQPVLQASFSAIIAFWKLNIIQVLSYLEPVFHGATKRDSEASLTLTNIMAQVHQTHHRGVDITQRGVDILKLFGTIYAARHTALRDMHQINAHQSPPYFAHHSPLLPANVDHDIAKGILDEYDEISLLLKTALSTAKPGKRPSSNDISLDIWRQISKVDQTMFKNVMDRTGFKWWTNGNLKVLELRHLSQAMYIAIHVPRTWDKEHLACSSVHRLFEVIKQDAHFHTWFLLPPPPMVTFPSLGNIVNQRAVREASMLVDLAALLELLLFPPAYSIEATDDEGKKTFKLTIDGSTLWNAAVENALRTLVILERCDHSKRKDMELLAPVYPSQITEMRARLDIPKPLVANNAEVVAYLTTVGHHDDHRFALYHQEVERLTGKNHTVFDVQGSSSYMQQDSADLKRRIEQVNAPNTTVPGNSNSSEDHQGSNKRTRVQFPSPVVVKKELKLEADAN